MFWKQEDAELSLCFVYKVSYFTLHFSAQTKNTFNQQSWTRPFIWISTKS